MDDGLKQRLIGAFVLFALLVIFVPVLFDRDRIEPVDKKTQIPAAPYIEPVEVAEVVEVEAEQPAPEPEEMYIPDEDEPVIEEAVESNFDANGVPKGWVLQVASFRFEKHAEAFRDKLIAEEYAAYVRTLQTERGKMTRVYVGPKIDKSILLKQKAKIKRDHKLEPILLKFEP